MQRLFFLGVVQGLGVVTLGFSAWVWLQMTCFRSVAVRQAGASFL